MSTLLDPVRPGYVYPRDVMRVQFETWDDERFSEPTTRQDWPTREGMKMTLENQFVFLSSFSLCYLSPPIE